MHYTHLPNLKLISIRSSLQTLICVNKAINYCVFYRPTNHQTNAKNQDQKNDVTATQN